MKKYPYVNSIISSSARRCETTLFIKITAFLISLPLERQTIVYFESYIIGWSLEYDLFLEMVPTPVDKLITTFYLFHYAIFF